MGCPHCGQGALYRIEFPRIGISSYMCDECNIVWHRLADVGSDYGYALYALLSWMGYPDEREGVEIKERVDWPART